MKEELHNVIGKNEKILYEGKPDKNCYVFEAIFNPLLPFSIVWGIFDLFILGGVAASEKALLAVIVPFIAFHMMPVWIYLVGILFTFKRYKNTEYVITDRAIYVAEGVFTRQIKTKTFTEASHVDLKRGIFDQKFGVGDVIISSNQVNNTGPAVISINSILNYTEVYNLVKELQENIYTDVMYPNDKRPKENHGYKTEYKGEE